MSDIPEAHLDLVVTSGCMLEFYALLQQGFNVQVQCGGNLEELLCNQWGIDPNYVTARITTIFMNSRAIDSVPTTMVREGSTLALSGAMPGLVGATMRRGGFYAAMRGAMTHQDEAADATSGKAWIRVKLFNLLLPELGPDFLSRGLGLKAEQLASFLVNRDEHFWQSCRSIYLNGEVSGSGAVVTYLQELDADTPVSLSVNVEGSVCR